MVRLRRYQYYLQAPRIGELSGKMLGSHTNVKVVMPSYVHNELFIVGCCSCAFSTRNALPFNILRFHTSCPTTVHVITCWGAAPQNHLGFYCIHEGSPICKILISELACTDFLAWERYKACEWDAGHRSWVEGHPKPKALNPKPYTRSPKPET